VLRYTVDEANVEWTAYHLRAFLRKLAEKGKLDRLHVIAHSMGNRATTAALLQLADSEAVRSILHEVILAAPDIDAEVFRRDIAPALKKAGRRVTLYASSHDQALTVSKQIHGYPRAGETGQNLVVHPDIDTIDVSEVDTSFLGHSYYGDNKSLISDLMTLLLERLPPHERNYLLPRKHLDLPYWFFAPPAPEEKKTLPDLSAASK
jgi:esterase/lipase superfamily enzyme